MSAFECFLVAAVCGVSSSLYGIGPTTGGTVWGFLFWSATSLVFIGGGLAQILL